MFTRLRSSKSPPTVSYIRLSVIIVAYNMLVLCGCVPHQGQNEMQKAGLSYNVMCYVRSATHLSTRYINFVFRYARESF